MTVATTIEKQNNKDKVVPSLFEQVVELGGEMIVDGLTEKQFYFLTGQFPDLRMERDKYGKIIIMAPIAGFGGARENRLGRRLGNWRDEVNIGETFSPSTGFKLPNGATRSPDSSWLSDEKMEALQKAKDEKGFLKVVPDFVAELMSENDRLKKAKEKMENVWIANGVQLAWLIDPYKEQAFVYRKDGTIEKVSGFDKILSGEDVLPGFELKLEEFKLTAGR